MHLCLDKYNIYDIFALIHIIYLSWQRATKKTKKQKAPRDLFLEEHVAQENEEQVAQSGPFEYRIIANTRMARSAPRCSP